MTIQAAKDAIARGDLTEARRILESILATDKHNEAALELMMLHVADDEGERRQYATKLLQVNQRHDGALKVLSGGRMGADDLPDTPQEALNMVGNILGGMLRGSIGGNNPFRDMLNQYGPPTFMAGAQSQRGGQTREPEKVYEMLWDCRFCGTKKLLGKTHRFCPNCGAAQDPATRYFPSDEEKVAVEDHVFVGKDLICGSCGTLNAGNAEFCQNCGASLENAQRATTLDQQMAAASSAFVSTGSRDLELERFNEEQQRIMAAERARRAKERQPYIIAGAIGVVVLIGVVIFLLFRTWNASFTVIGHRWERTISIQEFSAVREGSWDELVPVGAYRATCYERQRGSRQVDTGRESCTNIRVDNGDGTFSQRQQCSPIYRDEPVYDTWCDYTIDRWVDVQPAVARGDSLSDEPRWPSVSLNTCSGSPRLGCERESGRDEQYVVIFAEGNDDRAAAECTFENEQIWRAFNLNSRWSGSKRAVGGLLCDTLEQG